MKLSRFAGVAIKVANDNMCSMKMILGPVALAILLAGCATQHKPKPVAVAPEPEYPYHSPLSTPGARFAALPTVVQNTVRSEAGTAEIVDVRKDTRDGRSFYKITFREQRAYPPLYIGPDGSVLNPDLSVSVPAPQEATAEVKLNDVPLGVVKAIQQRPSGQMSDVASVSKENWGDHTIYIVTFKDEIKNPKLYVVADGTVLIQAPK